MPARFLLPVLNNWHTLNDDEREKLHNGSSCSFYSIFLSRRYVSLYIRSRPFPSRYDISSRHAFWLNNSGWIAIWYYTRFFAMLQVGHPRFAMMDGALVPKSNMKFRIGDANLIKIIYNTAVQRFDRQTG